MIERELRNKVLAESIREAGTMVSQTTNLGETGDWNDLYTLVDYLAFAFTRAYPQSPCRDGCGHCCKAKVYRVSLAEWLVLEAHLDGMEVEARERILARNRERFGAHREALEQTAAFWETHDVGEPAGIDLPGECPALENERCTVYEARPLVCRAYGHFGVRIGPKESLLICQEFGQRFIDDLRASGETQLRLPPWGPYGERARALAESREVAPLPLWLLRYEDARISSPSP